MSFLRLVGPAAILAAVAAVPSDASASVSIAITFDSLCQQADTIAAITPGEATANWEDGRIFTYTKVHVDQGVAGELAAGQDTYVRTMGGVVGKLGQMVDGEAVFEKNKPSLLFLRKLKTGSYEVTARGQGQYPIMVDAQTKARSLTKSYTAGVLLPPKDKTPDQQAQASGVATQSIAPKADEPASQAKVLVRLATDVLHQRPFDDGVKEINTNWKRLHPAPATPVTPAQQTQTK